LDLPSAASAVWLAGDALPVEASTGVFRVRAQVQWLGLLLSGGPQLSCRPEPYRPRQRRSLRSRSGRRRLGAQLYNVVVAEALPLLVERWAHSHSLTNAANFAELTMYTTQTLPKRKRTQYGWTRSQNGQL